MSDKCDRCGRKMRVGMFPFCKGDPADHGDTRKHFPFKAYDVEVDGAVFRIDSIQAASKIERESMQRYRNGEGAPVVFRAFHQDSSNATVNVFGSPDFPKFSTRNRKGEPYITVRKSRSEP